MAVITASLIAVGAAVASMGAVGAGIATVATIGTIAAVVGGVGLALGVAGMVTGNKTLTKIGTYLGAAAAGGGLGALAASALNLAPAAASTGGTAVTAGAGAATDTVSSTAPAAHTLVNPELGASISGSIQQAGQVGAGTVLAPAAQAAAPAVSSGGGLQAAVGGAGMLGQQVTDSMPKQQGIAGVSIDTAAATRAPRPDPVNDAWMQATKGGTQAPPNPTIQATIPPAPARSDYTGLLALSGTQLLSNSLNGVFQGQAAGNQMQLQMDQNAAQNRLAQQQIDLAREQQDRQRQNAMYAPLVSFRGGLISKPGKA